MRQLRYASILLIAACNAPAPRVVEPAPLVVEREPQDAAPIAAEDATAYRATPDEPFRASAPNLPNVAPFSMPTVTTFSMKNGASAWVLERHTLPRMVRVRLVFALRDAPATPLGATTMVGDALRRGTPRENEQDLSQRMTDLSLVYEFRITPVEMDVSVTTTPDNLDGALKFLSDILRVPEFPQQHILRGKNWQAVQSEARDQRPYVIAQRLLPMALFGRNEPLDTYEMVRPSDFLALSRDDVMRTFVNVVDPSRATFVVVGDTTPQEAKTLLQRQFSSWVARKHSPTHARAPFIVAPSTPHIVVVDRPGSTQAFVGYGMVAPGRESPDAYAAFTTQWMFFAPEASLTHVLRDERNAIAGAQLYSDALPNAMLFTWGAEVPFGKTGDLVRELDHQAATLRDGPVSLSELESVRASVAASDANWLTTIATAGGKLAQYAALKIPPSELSTFFARTMAQNEADIHRVAQTMLDPARTKIVVVGDWGPLRSELLALGGPIEIRDANGTILRVEKP